MKTILAFTCLLFTFSSYAQSDGDALLDLPGKEQNSAVVQKFCNEFNVKQVDGSIISSETHWIQLTGKPISSIVLQSSNKGGKTGFAGKLPLGLRFGMSKQEVTTVLGNVTMFDDPSSSGDYKTNYFFCDNDVKLECRYSAEGQLIALIIENKNYRSLYDYWIGSNQQPPVTPEEYKYCKKGTAVPPTVNTNAKPAVTSGDLCSELIKIIEAVGNGNIAPYKAAVSSEKMEGTVKHTTWKVVNPLPGTVSCTVAEGFRTEKNTKTYSVYTAVVAVGGSDLNDLTILSKSKEWVAKVKACLPSGYRDRTATDKEWHRYSADSQSDMLLLTHIQSGTEVSVYQRYKTKPALTNEYIVYIKKQLSY